MNRIRRVFCGAAFAISTFASLAAHAKEITFLFIGNSYTYYPQTEKDPGMPHFFAEIVHSIDPDLTINYTAYTRGFYSFEKHFKDPASREVMEKHYDHVVLQGQSMESLQSTPWMIEHDMPGVASFEVYMPKVIAKVKEHNSDITMYVNWKWNAHNTLLVDSHPGLRFPEGMARAGQKWCGDSPKQYQNMINQSYIKHTAGLGVKLAFVGSEWLSLQEHEIVGPDELYRPGDWSHPSPLGTFVVALTLVHDILHLDVSKNTFLPPGVDKEKAEAVQKFVAFPPKEHLKVSRSN